MANEVQIWGELIHLYQAGRVISSVKLVTYIWGVGITDARNALERGIIPERIKRG